MAVVLPNDEIPAIWLMNSDSGKKKQKTVGAGLDITADRTLVARVAGILHETEHKIWIESAETRFEGATKRNKPNIKTGSLIYGQLTCVDNDQRAQGMGVIQTPGTVIQIPLSAARRLLKPNNKLISALGEHLKFELVVGMNGHVMITGAPRTVVAIQKAILQSINTFEANYEKLKMPCVLSRGLMPATRKFDVIAIRLITTGTVQPKPALKQLTVNESGHFKYERDWSRDSKAKSPQKPGDTPARVVPVDRVDWCLIEVWLDRSQSTPPWDWERVRDKYYKLPTLAFDPKGVSHQRLEIMEQLQDQMVEAAKKRGTR
ncbi:hypothetical protein M3Y98_00514100 [Aphelenchoides besseyi]|nr:hypothetical protein M3Y98_00514100 [Aphelenchoides besseyi]